MAFGFGLFGRINWLKWAAGSAAVLMLISLSTLILLVNAGNYPGATGMEGIALFVLPTMYLGSVLISFIIYGITVRIAKPS